MVKAFCLNAKGETMELFEQDVYQCEVTRDFDVSQMKVVFVLYQPLIGIQALSLYGTLLSEAHHQKEYYRHSRLCKLLSLDIDAVHKARIKLEQYNLIKTYHDKQNDEYIYVLVQPLKTEEFLRHYVYGVQYKKIMGLSDYELTKENMISSYDKKDFLDITTHFDQADLHRITSKDILEFITINQDEVNKDPNMGFPKEFDYQGFVKDLSELTFPRKLRTTENMRLIAQLATVYGISDQRMRVLACRSVNMKDNSFDTNGLINRVRREQVIFDDSQIDSYELAPIIFLQRKQPNMPVSLSSKKVLEYLVNDTPLSTPVINFLVEYVLNNTNNVLNQKYVEKTAETFVRNQVNDIASAKELIKKVSKVSKEKAMRANKPSESKVNTTNQHNGSKEELENLKRQILEKVERQK